MEEMEGAGTYVAKNSRYFYFSTILPVAAYVFWYSAVAWADIWTCTAAQLLINAVLYLRSYK